MDKFEYKVRADEIKDLIARGEYLQAAEIADTIDWRRVKSVMMLCTISDLYKINRRYDDARNMLFLAYERRPGGKTICYSLCELSIKVEDFVSAVKYYKEFVQAAPKDSGRYILQYKLYEAQDVGLEERIGVLEELKKRDYREKWAYELAYLYHRVGLATRCVEECDELILWFGEGKYVIKAMELKMLHQPLTPAQQEKYDHRFDAYGQLSYDSQSAYAPQEQAVSAAEAETGSDRSDYEASNYEIGGKTKIYQPVSQTDHPQKPAEQENFVEPESYTGQNGYVEQEDFIGEGNYAPEEALTGQEIYIGQDSYEEQPPYVGQESYAEQDMYLSRENVVPQGQEADRESASDSADELDIHVKTLDMGQYNTLNLQAEIAAGLKEVLEEDRKPASGDAITQAIMAPMLETETESLDMPEIDEVDENDLEQETEVMEESEVFFGETGEIADLSQSQPESADPIQELVPEISTVKNTLPEVISVEKQPEEKSPEVSQAAVSKEQGIKPEGETGKEIEEKTSEKDETAAFVMEQLKREFRAEEQALRAQPPKELAGVLSQESDGQISLVLPEGEQIEKQITGQMNLEDILAEWERMKQENAEKRKEEVRQHVLRHTGEMFTAFEASVRDGLLEQLEKEAAQESGEMQPEENPEGSGEEQEAAMEEFAEAPEEDYADAEEEQEAAMEAPAEAPEENYADSEEEQEAAMEGFAEAPEEDYADSEEEQEAAMEEPAEEPEEDYTDAGDEQEAAGMEEPAEEPEEDYGEAEDWDAEPQSKDGIVDSDEVEESEEIQEPEEIKEDSQQSPVEREAGKVRALAKEEKELYGPFIQSRASREQLAQAIDAISLAAYTGNIIITGEEGMDTVSLAKNMIREVQMTDSNFSGKVAKISGQALNKKDVEDTLNQLASGALIIQKATAMNGETVKMLHKALQKESFGIIIVLEDTRKAMNKFLEKYTELASCFTARMEVEALSNDTLVAFGKKYAQEREYSIDELGTLALHTRIDELQTIDHVVTVLEVKDIVDNAIRHANRKTIGHFLDILFARRYDDEDMIILSEKDFV